MPTAVSHSRAVLQTFQYSAHAGWSCGRLPELDSEHTFVVAFGAPEFGQDAAPLAELTRHFAKSSLVGCSTAGEIFGTRMHDATITVAAMRFARTRLRRVSAPVSQSTSFATGAALARQLAAGDLKAVFLLAEGLDINGSELVRGLSSGLLPGVVVTGGLAGDGDRFQRTWVLEAGAPASGIVSAVGFYGDALRVGHGFKGGWDAFGPERMVSRSSGNVLYELDGKPALALYKQYLGDRAKGLPATALLFPLTMRAPHDHDKVVVRTVLAVDEQQQSMRFAGDLPMGHITRFMRANFDRLVEGASAAARLSNCSDVPGPVLALTVSCVGRRLVLGERTEEEIEAALDALPAGTEQIGFYSYGEVSPLTNGQCDLHNQTMTLTTLAEA